MLKYWNKIFAANILHEIFPTRCTKPSVTVTRQYFFRSISWDSDTDQVSPESGPGLKTAKDRLHRRENSGD